MVKVCLDKFPEGSYKGQEGEGFYMDGIYKENLDILSRNITKDMQFVALISGDGTVRNGKSTLAMQTGYYYSYKVSQLTGKEVPFTIRNIVFKANDLISTAMTLPPYSCIILDEGDDLTAHYFSKLTQKLNKFFRKCGQLNLFIILILPDFFELKRGIAITRSNYLCNVKFRGEFERGYYDFYGPRGKKYLYIAGRKHNDYHPKGSNPNFHGRFVGLYPIDEKAYRAKKKRDLESDDDDDLPVAQQIRKEKAILFGRCVAQFPITSMTKLSKAFRICQDTATKYNREYKTMIEPSQSNAVSEAENIIKVPTKEKENNATLE